MGGKSRAEESSEGVIDEIYPEYTGAADEIGDSAKGARRGDVLGERGGEGKLRAMARGRCFWKWWSLEGKQMRGEMTEAGSGI